MVKTSDLLWYERLNEEQPFWYINNINYNIENAEEIALLFDIPINHVATCCYDYNYIPFPFVDYRQIKKDYLIVLNNRQITEYLNRLPEDQFNREFARIFHCGFEHDHWMTFRNQKKKEILIEWCKVNKIPYIDDFK